MIAQQFEVHLAQPIDSPDQTLIVGNPLSGMSEFDLCQENGLGLITIAVGEVVIRAVKNRFLYIPAPAMGISTLVTMMPNGSPQHRRPVGQQLQKPLPLFQQSLI